MLLLQTIKLFLRKRRMRLKEGTLGKYTQALQKLEAFISEVLKEQDIPLEALTYDFLEDFVLWCQETRENKNVTINRDLKSLRAILRWAWNTERIQHLPNAPFRFKLLKDDSDLRTFLSRDELTALWQLFLKDLRTREKLTPSQFHTLRAFLFSCFTGLRYSDVMNLTPAHITRDKSETFLVFKQEKTGEAQVLPLSPQALFLIETLEPYDGKIFRYYSNQVMNRALKHIAQLARIPKHITFHVARHTFATLLLNAGNTLETTAKLLGHKKLATTKKYARISTHLLKQAMKNFDDYLNKNKS